MDYTALASEVNSDPAALGLAALVAAGSDAGVAAALNEVRTGDAYLVNKGMMSRAQFVFDWSSIMIRIPGLASGKAPFWQFACQLILGADQIDVGSALLNGTLTNGSLTGGLRQQAVADGLCTDAEWAGCAYRQGSRAEVLWGAGTTVSANDVAVALRGNN